MVTAGGEVAFVTRMIEESLKLGKKIQWYTSMLGKLSSVTTLIEKLLEAGNQNWAITEFVQGSQTRRWAIAWSWRDLRPTTDVARHISGIPKHLLPFPPEFTFHPAFESITFLIRKINDEIDSLPMSWNWNQHASRGIGFAMENVWSRQARRKREQGENEEPFARPIDADNAALGFAVHVRQTGIENVDVIVRWIKGLDSVLFESFCGMFKRKVERR
ncbi:methyltransferase [Emydomyces testavorans]|uniref:Methyltransferase n=1 Tax=Emydomyces testavorans TaxID=2070801 RepID=A0AAF0DFU0_9EURO|nr:methyltransferase [Emydomyces testavorans]